MRCIRCWREMDCGAATPTVGKKIWACSTCGFRAKDSSSERAAWILLERELGMPLGKVEEGNQPTPDYRTIKSEAVVEVKQVTTEMFREAVGVQQRSAWTRVGWLVDGRFR